MHGEQNPTSGTQLGYSSNPSSFVNALAASVVLHLIALSVSQTIFPTISDFASSNQGAKKMSQKIEASFRENTSIETPVATSNFSQLEPREHTEPSGNSLKNTESHPARLAAPPNSEVFSFETLDYGTIKLRVWVDKFGKPRRLEVINSTLPKEAEEQVVVRFFFADYLPAMKNGKIIDSSIEFEISVNGR